MTKHRLLFLILAPLTLGASSSQGQVIDFETVPGGVGVPAELTLISDQYLADFGVSFSLVDAPGVVGPVIARTGSPIVAFVGPSVFDACFGTGFSTDDQPAPGEPVGCAFLTDAFGGPPPTVRVTYAVPVSAASGDLLDIDFAEQWTIRALAADATTEVDVNVITAGDPDTGDGIATRWSFSHPSADIYFIDFVYTGGGGAGMALDNFSPASATPTPTLPMTFGRAKMLYR